MNRTIQTVHGLIEAIPQPACLYDVRTKRMIPNTLWSSNFGETTSLGDLQSLTGDEVLLDDLINRSLETRSQITCSLDSQGARCMLISPVQDRDDWTLLFLHDETEARRVEQMRKDFIANVSHELRTPLTAVKGYVETLLDPRFQTIERVQEFLPIIFEHTERLHNLMLDLLSLSRLENPNTNIEITPIVLRDEIEGAIDATAPLARLKNLIVDIDPPPGGLRVLANSEHLERVLVNLLDNAIKYSFSGGRVRLWHELAEGEIRIHVSDEGPGIEPEEMPRVFERFYRTKGAITGRVRGSGLGLAIVKHIVQIFGGQVNASSVLDKGSDFSFSLRLAADYA
ncbi:MAG: ATP-binding protein [bacterium]|nr:ATP-binding protein [Candidatus Sumerlaeota bacterium]